MAPVTGFMHGGGFIADSLSLRVRPWLVSRTERSLRAAGLPSVAIRTGPETDWIPWAVSSAECPDSLTVIRAGAWFPQPRSAAGPEPSATGRPVVAFGLSQCGQDSPWRALRRSSGGDLSGLASRLPSLDFPPVLALDRRACEALRAGMAWDRLLRREARIVHLSTLDVLEDDGLRVCQAVTSLQYGGAERLALDLHRELRRTGTAARLLVLGRPGRSAFAWPEDCLDLSEIPACPGNRAMAVNAATVQFGADVLHAHLLDTAQIKALRPGAPPVVLTLHNTSRGWPAGLASLEKNEVTLLAACSLGVEEEARRLLPVLPVRTAWNGIDLHRFQPTARRTETAAAFRASFCGLPENGLLLLTLANPRPQKRLDRLPEVLAALKRRCPGRSVRLLLAGEPAAFNDEATACVAAVRQAAREHGVEGEMIFHGASDDPATLLAAADVLISTAAHEGLSLAHLEALAMGVPVVALEAGGTGEVAAAAEAGAFTRLPQHAGPDELAAAVVTAVATRVSGREAVRRCFSLETMARRYQNLYRTALMAPALAGNTIWLVTNNLSVGGAQSSAGRLLVWWHRTRGFPVRAAVLQEEPGEPTPGRRALEKAGIPVLVLPAIGPREAAETLEPLWPELTADPPRAVLLWNAVTSCKRMIADALPHTPVFDISPGGMFFEALHPSFSRLRPDLPALTPAAYGAQLTGAVVKYARERTQAETALGRTVRVIPNGVPQPETPVPFRPHPVPLIFGTAARLHPQKRLEDLLEAFRLALPSLPPSELHIAGGVDGGESAYAEALQAASPDLPVRWLGEILPVSRFHGALDVFVMISEPAGCPNASLEALAAGLPVIATDYGGVSEQVINGQTGLLVPNRDPAALASALIRMASDPDLRHRCAEESRRHVVRHFTMSRMAEDYERLIAPGPGAAPGRP